MFIIVGIKKNQKKVGVIDTQDMQVDWVSFTRLQEALNKGMQVQGLAPDGTILCQTEDVFNEIAEKLYNTCAKIHLLHIQQEQQIKQMFFNIAQPYGLAITPDDLSVSVAQAQIYFKICNRVCNFGDKSKVVIQAATQGLTYDEDLLRMAGRGVTEYHNGISLYFGVDEEIQILVSELNKVLLTDKKANSSNKLYYIGYTPSNMVYKFIIGDYIYSLHLGRFSTSKYNYLRLNELKKKCIAKASPTGYESYLETRYNEFYRNGGYSCFIDKLTKKSIKALDVVKAYWDLKNKYGTLRDMYREGFDPH